MKLAILASLLVSLSTPAVAETLTLDLSTRASGGQIAVAIYRDAETFRRGDQPIASRMVARTGPVTTVVIPGLTPGRYAVAAFHDTDGNGTLTLWPIGMPREPYGFSRNARGQLGPPGFDAAAFDLPATGTRQAFTLR